MYSSGNPILYIVTMLSFFFTYWFDKFFCNYLFLYFLVLKFYRNPPAIGRDLSSQTISLMHLSLVLHFVVGFFMFSNSTILSSFDLKN